MYQNYCYSQEVLTDLKVLSELPPPSYVKMLEYRGAMGIRMLIFEDVNITYLESVKRVKFKEIG